MNSERIKQLEFHMRNNELHAQVATILELVREGSTSKGWSHGNDRILKGVVEELMFVHNNYQASFQSKTKEL